MDKKIKTVKAFTSFKDMPESEFLSAYTSYDINGNELESQSYQANDVIEIKTESKYDENNRKTEEINYLNEDEIGEHFFYFYDENGRVTKEIVKYADGSETIRTYKRDPAQNSLVITAVDDEGDTEGSEEFHYSEQGLLLEKIIYDEFENLQEKQINEYNQAGLLIKSNRYEAGGEYQAVHQYEYNEEGNLTKEVVHTPKGKLIEAVYYTYDEKNRIVETRIDNRFVIKYTYNDEKKEQITERFQPNGFLEFKKIMRFNDDNLLKEVDENTQFTRYEYDFYDKQNRKE